MKNSFHTMFPALSLGLCAVLALGTLIVGPSSPGANEILSPAPSLNTDTVLSQTSAWFSDHFFGRQELITAYAKLNAALFHTSIREDVILGDHGWLYFTSTLDDFAGNHRLDVQKAAANLELMGAHCETNGVRFLFAGIPNKNTLYPNEMPNRYAASPVHDLHRLIQTADVPMLDVLSLQPHYFAHDSHWNSMGAAITADAINFALGRSSSYQDGPFTDQPHRGDLFEMLYPAAVDNELSPVYTGPLSFRYTENSGTKPDSITIRTESGAEGSLLLYRDSFGNLLYPYLADSFRHAVFSRSNIYDLSGLEGVSAVVIELVERNLTYLTKYIPVMPAPEQLLSEGAQILPWELNSHPSSMEGYLLYEGTDTPENCTVYLCTDTTAYSCFLLDQGRFAAHIPESVKISGVVIQHIN